MIQDAKSIHLSGILKSLGPGLIFAGTSIGVSHVVQSTRAGADYGFALVWAVILANVFKFPFFEQLVAYLFFAVNTRFFQFFRCDSGN